jgi:isochorismate hydrolase
MMETRHVTPMLLVIDMQVDFLECWPAASTLWCSPVSTRTPVRMTAINAYQRDLDVIIPREAVGSYDREHAAVSLRYMDGKIARVVPLAEAVRAATPR